MTMHLTYVCHEPLPSHHTNTEQVVATASSLVGAGAAVDLTFPVPAAWPFTTDHTARVGRAYGVPTSRFTAGLRLVPRRAPLWVRGNAVRVWQAWTAPRALRDDARVFYTRDPLPLVSTLRTGRPVIFETYRLDFSRSPRFALWRHYCYRHPNLIAVVAHSRLARDAIVAAGVEPERVLIAHNGVPASVLVDDPGRDTARARTGLNAKAGLVVYAGHVGRTKGLDVVLALARQRRAVTFVILGHVPGSAGHRWLETARARARLDNVRLVARVLPADVADYLFAADVLLIPPTGAPLHHHGRTVLPMKLFSYLAAGRVIIAPQLPDIQEVLKDGQNGVLVPPDDVEAAANALDRVLRDRERACRLGAAARHDAHEHTWDRRGDRILTFVRERSAASA